MTQCYGLNWSTVEGIKAHCRVIAGGCWIWCGGCEGDSPRIRAFNPSVGAKRPMTGARAMWLAAFGREPRTRAFNVCGTPKCLNPLHLREAKTQGEMVGYFKRLGRYKGHTRQRVEAGRKGRAAQGYQDTPEDVVRAIKAAPDSITHTALAMQVGVHRKTVSYIRRGLWYREVDPVKQQEAA